MHRPRQTAQVLLNLAGNAVKYTATGEVRIQLAPHGAHGAVIRVEDTGVGIGAADLAKIYEPFW